jgi:DNA polymerase-1
VAKILYTDELQLSDLDAEQQDWLYNAKDCCIPHQIDAALEPRLTPAKRRIYRFEMAQQAVAWDMMRRGVLINNNAREGLLHELTAARERVNRYINRLAEVMWGKSLNPKSPQQLQAFFYDHLKLPVHYRQDKGRKVPTTNIEALESFKPYFYIKPIVNALLSSGDLHGQIKVLASGIDPDGRFRASLNVGGTETGRWSSSKNPNGRGTNSQNITERMRSIFIADPGEILVCPDLEQAESYAVAYLSGDEAYIRACRSADLHTTVAKLIWPDAEWPGTSVDDIKFAKEAAFYRHFSRRDLSKRAGHLSNYWGTRFKLSTALNIELHTSERFQADYFGIFPGIPAWHRWIIREVQATSKLSTPFGRERTFFGRTKDKSVLKEAIACVPQSTIGDLLNLGLVKTWYHLQLKAKQVHCLLQLHDGFLVGVPEDDLDLYVELMRKLMTIPIPVTDIHGRTRTMTVPVEFKVGYNWRDMEVYGTPAAAKLKRDDATYDPTTWLAG